MGCPINCFAQAMICEKRKHHPGSGVNFQRNASGDSGSWIHRKHMKSWAGALGGSNHAVWRVVGRKASHHPRSRPIRRPHGQLLGCIRKQVKTSDQAFDRHDPTSKKGGLNGAVSFSSPEPHTGRPDRASQPELEISIRPSRHRIFLQSAPVGYAETSCGAAKCETPAHSILLQCPPSQETCHRAGTAADHRKYLKICTKQEPHICSSAGHRVSIILSHPCRCLELPMAHPYQLEAPALHRKNIKLCATGCAMPHAGTGL